MMYHCVLAMGCLIIAYAHKTLCKCVTLIRRVLSKIRSWLSKQATRHKPSHYCPRYYVHGTKHKQARIGVKRLRGYRLMFVGYEYVCTNRRKRGCQARHRRGMDDTSTLNKTP